MAKYGPLFCNFVRSWDEIEPMQILRHTHASNGHCLEIHTNLMDHYTVDQLKDFRKMAEDFDIEVAYAAALPDGCCAYSEDVSEREKCVKEIERLIKRQDILGGKLMDGQFTDTWPGFPPAITFDRDKCRELSADTVRRICKVAQDHGQIITQEIYNRFEGFMINTAKEAVSFAKMVDMPNLKITFDTYHANIEEDNWVDCIRTLGDLCGQVHLGESNRKLPGSIKTKVDWDTIFTELNRLHYDGMFIFEAFILDQGTISKNVSLWRDLSDKASMEQLYAMNAASFEFVKHKYEVETRG